MKKKKLNESIMKNLKEYVNILNIGPEPRDKEGLWLKGEVEINNKAYNFSAKVYMEPSEFGINGGKVSKLCIGDDEKCILNYDRGWDILDKMITPDILEDMVEALETFRDENPYEVIDESLKEDFWNPGKYFRALQDMEDIDADKWNSANQEERDKMVTPYLTNFWNKYKEEMTQANLDALFDDMEDSNYHTPARILADIINKDRNKGIKESAKTLKEEFMIPENTDDGWGDDIEDLLEEPIDRVERLGYEVRNAIRGSYADFGETPDDLVEELYSISKHFEEVADELQSQGYEYIKDDEDLEESCKGKKKNIVKEKLMIPEDPGEGWGKDIRNLVKDTFKRAEKLGHEIENSVRGKENVEYNRTMSLGENPESLIKEISSLSKAFKDLADELKAQGFEFTNDPSKYDELEESFKGKKAVKEAVEDTSIGPVADHIKRDIENMVHQGFDGTDFLASVNDIDLNSGVVSVHITAFGPDENEDGNNAMERDIELHIPSLNYEAALFNEIENWMSAHSSPDSFYESAAYGDKENDLGHDAGYLFDPKRCRKYLKDLKSILVYNSDQYRANIENLDKGGSCEITIDYYMLVALCKMYEERIKELKEKGMNESMKLQEKINQENKEINDIIGKALRSKTLARKYEDKFKELGIEVDYSEPQGVILKGPNGKTLEASRDYIGGPSNPGRNQTHDKPWRSYKKDIEREEKEIADLKALKRDDIIRKYPNLSTKDALKKHKDTIKSKEDSLGWYKKEDQENAEEAKRNRQIGHLKNPGTHSWNREFGKPFADKHVDYLNYLTKPNTGDDFRKGKELSVEKTKKYVWDNGEVDFDKVTVKTKNPVSNKVSDTISKYKELKRNIDDAEREVDWHTYDPKDTTSSSYAAMTDEQLEKKIQKMRDDLEKQIEQIRKDNSKNTERRNQDIAEVKEREKELDDFLRAKGVRESEDYYKDINLKRLDAVIKESTK